jgi:hypothetical protein
MGGGTRITAPTQVGNFGKTYAQVQQAAGIPGISTPFAAQIAKTGIPFEDPSMQAFASRIAQTGIPYQQIAQPANQPLQGMPAGLPTGRPRLTGGPLEPTMPQQSPSAQGPFVPAPKFSPERMAYGHPWMRRDGDLGDVFSRLGFL